jgi:hypothetical protein
MHSSKLDSKGPPKQKSESEYQSSLIQKAAAHSMQQSNSSGRLADLQMQ